MKKTALVIAISSVVSTPLFAQDSINPYADEKTGFYLGLGAGAASYDNAYEAEKDYYDGFGLISGSYKSLSTTKRDGVVKLFSGYRLNKYLALEASYTKFADTESEFNTTHSPSGLRLSREVENEISGYGMKAIGIYPITNDVELNASFGLMKWKIKEDRKVSGIYAHQSSETAKGTSKVFGLGASYNLTNNVAFGIDWERINDLGDKDKLQFGETDVDTFTLSAKYTF
ncbi:outer membrane beta-barrel protein [Zooshikella sp. RANM57]|uniref:outer membrane beta-barrel protein n=1 Tax=Zooshikella sp. RANM57 TaxID=3425863 RepID=UPI003D6FD2DA